MRLLCFLAYLGLVVPASAGSITFECDPSAQDETFGRLVIRVDEAIPAIDISAPEHRLRPHWRIQNRAIGSILNSLAGEKPYCEPLKQRVMITPARISWSVTDRNGRGHVSWIKRTGHGFAQCRIHKSEF